MRNLYIIINSILFFSHFIKAQVLYKQASEPFVLAVYDSCYDSSDSDQLMNAAIQKLHHNGTKVYISNPENTTSSNTYLEGTILKNTSLKIDNIAPSENLHFLRVDSKTHRLKLCPNGESSKDFKVVHDSLYYHGSNQWSICFDEGENSSFVYHGSIKDNRKYCCYWDQEVELRTIGKFDASGSVPDYPYIQINQ
ncbi:hypothetical protein KGF56_003682 [Candida oxycetoniae]|uniref:Uncharacterized protein n=1 Tax=Candida oxycetoniae TaxID=497107 RepID=A0AAI9SVZ0_9ASCO|nr:uncharacterized protein KGF56_003682 [Candida oxycetoniae]KAI3403525.2 hypothetical protein KGF56_003682 [Candida oxycetoniae]